MAGYASGEAELFKQKFQPIMVTRSVRIDLGVGAFEICMCDKSRTAMSRTDDIDHVEILTFDNAIQVDVDEIEAWCCPPMTNESRLHVLASQRFAQQRVIEEVDLAH